MVIDCDRKDLQGNLLKRIEIRVDYKDLFELSGQTKKEIEKISSEYDMINHEYIMLEDEDFELNDAISFTRLPHEYLTDIESHLFFNESEDYFIEINQLFLKISKDIKVEYNGFEKILELYIKLLQVLFIHEDIKLKRVGIKKSNEVIFEDHEKLSEYFKKELIRFDQFDGCVDWKNNFSQSYTVQNFKLDSCFVNFMKLFDNGLINKKKYHRLYFEFEAYLRDCNNITMDNVEDKFFVLNSNIFCLFKNSLTEKTINMLKNKERIGDV